MNATQAQEIVDLAFQPYSRSGPIGGIRAVNKYREYVGCGLREAADSIEMGVRQGRAGFLEHLMNRFVVPELTSEEVLERLLQKRHELDVEISQLRRKMDPELWALVDEEEDQLAAERIVETGLFTGFTTEKIPVEDLRPKSAFERQCEERMEAGLPEMHLSSQEYHAMCDAGSAVLEEYFNEREDHIIRGEE